MDLNRPLYLTEYTPESELVAEAHQVVSPAFPVFDFHTHFGYVLLGPDYERAYDVVQAVELMQKRGVRRMVNLDGLWGEELDRMLSKTRPCRDFIVTFGTVDTSRVWEPGFEAYAAKTLRESKDKGIKGLKFLKDTSLRTRGPRGESIPIDDRRYDVIWNTAAELKLPVLIHIGDPKAFFKPCDAKNERYEEIMENPDWSFCSNGFYTFEELMSMQEKLLASNPATTFVVAHVGSYSENLRVVGKWLDAYPNMYVDIAERISELGRQPRAAAAFFKAYEDRILFGTDTGPMGDPYPGYYRVLETADEYFDYSPLPIPPQGRWKAYGLGLDRTTLEKVYQKNGERVLGL